MSGSEMQRAKESAAEIMRKKQAAGESLLSPVLSSYLSCPPLPVIVAAAVIINDLFLSQS
jgi:hypothetical protein